MKKDPIVIGAALALATGVLIAPGSALDQALGPPSQTYTTGLAQNQPILAAHIQELRNRVLAAWNSGTGGVDVRWLQA